MHTHRCFVALAASASLFIACQSKHDPTFGPARPGNEPTLSSNITVLQAAQSLTDGIFANEAPVVTSAIKNLPEATQVMVQAAFATLQKGIDEAEQVGWEGLSASNRAVAQGAFKLLVEVRDALHATIHDANALVPATLMLQDPNGMPVAVPVPIADPNASVAVDPNTVASLTSSSDLLSTDPCARLVSDPNVVPTPTSPLLVAP